MMDKSQT